MSGGWQASGKRMASVWQPITVLVVGTAIMGGPKTPSAQTFKVCDPISPAASYCAESDRARPYSVELVIPGEVVRYRVREAGRSLPVALSFVPEAVVDTSEVEQVFDWLVAGLSDGATARLAAQLRTGDMVDIGSRPAAQVYLAVDAPGADWRLARSYLTTSLALDDGVLTVWTLGEPTEDPEVMRRIHGAAMSRLRVSP